MKYHKYSLLFDRTNVGGGEVKASGGFDHGGEDEASEGGGGGDAIEGGGGGDAGQKLNCPASRKHLFALATHLLSVTVHLFTEWISTTPALISLPHALYALPTVHHVH